MARLRGLFHPPEPTRVLDRFAGPLDAPLRLLFEDPSAGRAIADRHGRLLRANARLQRMVGAALELATGLPLRLLFADADRDGVWAELLSVLRATAPAPLTLTARLTGAADAALTVGVTCVPLLGDGGVVEGMLLSAHDVSLQSRLEARLAQSQRLEAAGRLAGGIAHDFNNLLTAIRGGVDAIGGRGGLDAETQEDVEAIRASAERGAALVRQLLAFGRQQTLQPRVLAVNEAVAGLAGVLRRMLGGLVRLEIALEAPGRAVRVDPAALDQVLVNLAVNGRDAMPAGGTLTLRTGQLTLHRPLARGAETIAPGNYVMLEVRDSGGGIAPEVLPHIFEPFFTTRREAGGSGLGLSTVHGIVRQCGGFLAVESAPGQGTRIRVYLPAWEGEVPAPVAAARARAGAVQPSLPFLDPVPPPRGAVLLVDDEDVVRRVAERSLARQGWRVLAAATGEAALEMLAAEPPPALAAMVSDLLMPGMDGAMLVAAVRARLGRPDLPAVLVSGYSGEGFGDRLAELGEGHARFLAKPYDVKELAALLAELAA
jgi:two-component system cell cycle sensor histidine kinase/response regulator CckA